MLKPDSLALSDNYIILNIKFLFFNLLNIVLKTKRYYIF